MLCRCPWLDCCTGMGLEVNSGSGSGSGDQVGERELPGDDASDRNSGDVVVIGAPQGTWSDSLRLRTCCEE